MKDRAEIAQLLQQAFNAAQRMRLPEAGQIADIFKQIFGVEIPTSQMALSDGKKINSKNQTNTPSDH